MIVTKPGPSIITEAMTTKLPIVAIRTPLYTEFGNGALIERYQLGREAVNPDQVPALVKEVLATPYAGQPYQSPDAAKQIAEFIISKSAPVTKVPSSKSRLSRPRLEQLTALTSKVSRAALRGSLYESE